MVNELTFCGFVARLKQKFTISGGGVVPGPEQDPNEAVRFLKKRYFFTQHGLVVAPHEKYVDELYNLEGYKPKATPDMSQWTGDDGEVDPQEAHQFRSAMGTLLYLSADRWDIQHSIRNLAQWMAKPTKLAKAGVRHVILQVPMQCFSRTRYQETRWTRSTGDGHVEPMEKVEIFMDSDRASDR